MARAEGNAVDGGGGGGDVSRTLGLVSRHRRPMMRWRCRLRNEQGEVVLGCSASKGGSYTIRLLDMGEVVEVGWPLAPVGQEAPP